MDLKNLKLDKVPKHIAIILDGNGRWAKKRLLPRNLGHRKGAFNLIEVAKECNNIGIKVLTVFCFSTENWKRPSEEVKYLMNKPISYYKKYRQKLFDSSYVVKFIGRRDRLNKELLNCIEEAEECTKNHTGLKVVVAFDYGSYDEITECTKLICKKVLNKELDINDISSDTISQNLYTKDLPKLDLLIRTSGEYRLSNFLLWQAAYSELYFTDVLWPDFDREELLKAISSYQKRDRRFGGLSEEVRK